MMTDRERIAREFLGWEYRRHDPHTSNPMFWTDRNGKICNDIYKNDALFLAAIKDKLREIGLRICYTTSENYTHRFEIRGNLSYWDSHWHNTELEATMAAVLQMMDK